MSLDDAYSALADADAGMTRYDKGDHGAGREVEVLLHVIASALLAIAHGLIVEEDD